MRVLIIDNNTTYIDSLKSLISKHSFSIVHWEDFKYQELKDFDLIIFSGGHPNTIERHHELFEEEIKVILRSDIPILGICLGFELIVYAFGGKLKELPGKETGKLNIEIVKIDDIFEGIKNFTVFENHRWVAESLPKDLLALAKSKDGVEIIKHSTKFIYGFQFHPEIVVDKNDLRIFNNLVILASK